MSAPVLSWLFIALGGWRAEANLSGPPKIRPVGPQREPQSLLADATLDTETPRPNPQSQSFSRGYGSILPTSLIYIVLSTRGCSPWRPDAVMSTTKSANKSRHWVFKGRRKCTRTDKKRPPLPQLVLYLGSIPFHSSNVR